MAAAEAPEKKSAFQLATHPNTRWYFGNCHCAAVKFKVHMPSLDEHQVKTCNCSICSRNGYMHVYPARADVVYLKGEDSVKGYYFGGKKAEHKFCPNCGSSISVDPHGAFGEEDMVSINDVELDQLKVGTVDGKTFGAPYDPK